MSVANREVMRDRVSSIGRLDLPEPVERTLTGAGLYTIGQTADHGREQLLELLGEEDFQVVQRAITGGMGLRIAD